MRAASAGYEGVELRPTLLGRSDDVLQQQRRLKRDLLDAPHAIRWPSARELAAYMLLSIDEPEVCWRSALDFLRQNLGVERVDGGYASPDDDIYWPASSECRSGPEVPSLIGMAVDNHAPAARQIWLAGRPLVHNDMTQDLVFDDHLRKHFLAIGTVGKMTCAVVFRNEPIGLVCADRMSTGNGWQAAHYDCFDSVTRDVMAPILHAARMLTSQFGLATPSGKRAERSRWTPGLATLSRAELQVCRLVAEGLSYKEIALRINRSFSTVDHHLRSIRTKLQIRSTGKLVSELSKLQDQISECIEAC